MAKPRPKPPAHFNPDPRFGLVPVRIGLLDLRSNTWVGDAMGPYYFGNRDLALVAHTILSIQLGTSGHNLALTPLPHGPYTLRDRYGATLPPEQAWAIAIGEA